MVTNATGLLVITVVDDIIAVVAATIVVVVVVVCVKVLILAVVGFSSARSGQGYAFHFLAIKQRGMLRETMH